MADERGAERGALVHGDEFIWHLRYLFLKSLEEVAQPAISELQEDVYPLYQNARGDLKDDGLAIFSFPHKEGAVQVGLTSVLNTPFANFHLLCRAIVTEQAGVNQGACLELGNGLLQWAKKYRISPDDWSSSKPWILNSVMFALGSFHSRKDTKVPFGFTMLSNINKAPLPVTLEPVIKLEWELTKETKAKFRSRAMREAKKQIEGIVDEAFESGRDRYEPSGFVPFKRPQLLERDMRWLVAYQCLKKDETDISVEYPYVKYRKKKKKEEDVGAGAVREAIEARAKEIDLILWKK